MAGDQEPPVRYRGEPPRYSERVVDPENPIPAGRRGRTSRDDEWGAEAYAPGLPGSEHGGAPADWDDVPLRPVRRRTRHDDLGRTRRDTPPTSGAEPGAGRARGDYDADTSRRSRGTSGARGEAASRRSMPELEVGDARRTGRTAAEVNAAQRSSSSERAVADQRRHGPRNRADLENGETSGRVTQTEAGRDRGAGRGRRRSEDESHERSAAPIDSPRKDSDHPPAKQSAAVPDRHAIADNDPAVTGGGARSDHADRPDANSAMAQGPSGTTNREPDERPTGSADAAKPGFTDEVAAGPAAREWASESGTEAGTPLTESVVSEYGVDRAERTGVRGAGSDIARADARTARDLDREVAGHDDAERVDGIDDGFGRSDDNSELHNSTVAHDIPSGGRKRRRVDGSGVRPEDREISYGNDTPQPSELPAGFDRSPRTREGREMTGNHERGSRRDTGYDTGMGSARSADRRTEGTARRGGRGNRALRDRNGSKISSYEQLSGNVPGSGADRRARPAKKKNQGPSLLDDASRARLEAVAREGAGLRAAWAAFRIHTDDLRRVNAAARIESVVEDGFDRGTAQLTDRGYIGEGGGRMNVVGRPVEYRATTAQVAGLWPWSVGAGAPLIGTPLGSHLHTGAPVCFDPMNWFMRGSFITAPSLFVLGLNGFGKSSLVRRIVLGGVAQGITPLILADVKPDYRKLVEMVGGQVIDLGYGHGKLNPLAGGVLGSIVPMLTDLPDLQLQVTQELRARQVTLIAGLVELVRGARVRDYEETLISTALRILYREGSGFAPESPPIMEDLLEVVIAGGQELMLDAGADNVDEYHEATKGLRRSLRALTQGPFGAVFNGQTTTPIDTSAVAVCIDVSHIPSGDKKLKAAVMLACWADGFASVEAAHVLADGKLGAQRYFQVVMDELWQVLGLGDFMVDRVDELTRLQRGMATSLIMISHTIKDLQSLGSEAAIAKALGFLERARAKIFGALPPEEISRLDSTIPFTSAEEEMVTSWSAPQALTGEALKPGQARPPAPGTGKFLLKIGEDRRPGIPFHMEFTASEKESGIHETNQRFSEFTESTARRGDEGSAA